MYDHVLINITEINGIDSKMVLVVVAVVGFVLGVGKTGGKKCGGGPDGQRCIVDGQLRMGQCVMG